MESRNPYVDDRIMHRIMYRRGMYSLCIYCGKKANSREHIPSRVFLKVPYPDNLGIVPACKRCNNGYSSDEIFLYLFIEKLKKRFYKDYEFSNDTLLRIGKYKSIVNEVDGLINNAQGNLYSIKDLRVNNVLEKLALGHAVYELSVGWRSESWSGKCNYLYYGFFPNLSVDEMDEIDSCFNLNDYMLPEVGSRIFDKIYVIKLTTESGKEVPLCLLDWIDVQDNTYRYTCFVFDHTIIVKIVISEFLYAVITFEEEL